ncbi:membrane hypothetical protein [Gammaproteobacteria bacterium]
MTFDIFNIVTVGPEIMILGGACIILMMDAFRSTPEEENVIIYWFSLIILLSGCGIIIINLGNNIGSALNGHFFKDTMGDLLKILTYFSVFISFIYSRVHVKRCNSLRGEFFILGLFAVLGMSVMISAGSFITLFMGLELLTLPLYIMAIFDYDSVLVSKIVVGYFIRGGISSGILLYGMSLLYGVTGSLNLIQISNIVQKLSMESTGQNQILLIFGTVFIIIGVSFKFGSLPINMWISNIYQDISSVVILFLSTIPKLIVFSIIVRLLVGTLDPLIRQWQQILIVIALFFIVAASSFMVRRQLLEKNFSVNMKNHISHPSLG